MAAAPEAEIVDWSAWLATAAEQGLGVLLKDPEIAGPCKTLLAEAGCRPPTNHLVYFLMRKAIGAAADYTAASFKSRALAWLANHPSTGRVLSQIAQMHSELGSKEALKRRLLEDLQGRGVSPEDIAHNAATPLEVVQAVYQNTRLDGLEAGLQDVLATLQADLAAHFADMFEPASGFRLIDAPGSSVAAINFRARPYGLFGRKSELNELAHFLGDLSQSGPAHDFRWLLITGEGGEGKSRLARALVEDERCSAPWRRMFLSEDNLKQLVKEGRWTPRATPTLFVIDYPAQTPEAVRDLLRLFARRHADFDAPVRVLLLEREAEGEWFKTVLPAGSETEAVRQHCFRSERYAQGWALPPLSPDAIVELMQERFEEAGQTAPHAAVLFDAAVKVDTRQVEVDGETRPAPRALFAAAAAEVLIRQLADAPATDAAALAAALSRESVLDALIERERAQFWKPAAGGNAALLAAHERLLALATFVLGIGRSALPAIWDGPLSRLLPPDDADAARPISDAVLSAMGSTAPGRRIRKLEPDLLGEHFVRQKLDTLTRPEERAAIVDWAFAHRGDNAAVFVLRLLRSFPQLGDDIVSWLPSDRAPLAAARLCSKLSVTLADMFGAGGAYGPLDAVLSRLGALALRFSGDVDFARMEASAAYAVIYHAGGAGDLMRIKSMFARLDVLTARFPHDFAIAREGGKAAVGLLNAALKAGDRDIVAAAEFRLEDLAERWPRDVEIARLTATAARNVIFYSTPQDKYIRVDAMLDHLAALSRCFPGDVEIAQQVAASAVNVTRYVGHTNYWARVQAVFERFDDFVAYFKDCTEIAVCEAKSCVNVTQHAGAANDWTHVEVMLGRLDALAGRFPVDAAIARLTAGAAINVTSHAGNAGDWTRVEAMRARILRLLSRFSGDQPLMALAAAADVSAYAARRRHRLQASEEDTGAAASAARFRIATSLAEGSDFGITPSMQVIKDAAERFPNNAEIAAIKAKLTAMGVDWDDVPPLEEAAI